MRGALASAFSDSLPAMGMVVLYAFAAAAYRAVLGFDPPFGEVTIGTLGTIAVGKMGISSYQWTSVQREQIRAGVTTGPPTPAETPAVGGR